MAKFPIDLSRFKKISTNGKSTLLSHPSGHKFIVSHNALSPEHREQLHALPFAEADSKMSKKPPAQKAKGGEIKDPTQRHTHQGDQIPNRIEKGVVKHAKARMADGGDPGQTKKDDVPEPNKKAAADFEKGATSAGTVSAGQAWNNIKSGLGFADGGEVPSDAENIVNNLDQNASQAATAAPPASQQSAIVPAADASDANSPQPTPSPTDDPALARKRELYNYAQAQLNPSEPGANPRQVLGPDLTFGPNGEAPAQFNPAAWNKAEQQFKQEQVNKVSSSAQAIQAAEVENKARQAAGLPPLPVPQAAESAIMAGKEAPKAGETTPVNTPQVPSAQNGVPQDPYGFDAYSKSYMQGLGEQKAGIAAEAKAQAAKSQADAQQLAVAQKQKEDEVNNYHTNYNNIDQERKAHVSDIANSHIDPEHYMSQMGTGKRIATSIGLILGGMGAGLTGGPNQALEMLKMHINNDIDAQKTELGKRENLLSANMRQFGNLRDATEMSRVMMNDATSLALQKSAAQQGGALAEARKLQVMGALDKESSAIVSQIAMRKTLMQGANTGRVDPGMLLRAGVIPKEDHENFVKDLGKAKQDVAFRDNVLSSFDELAKLNTVGGLINPQTRLKVAALKNTILDKLTKDTSGRVTPETVKLIGSGFDTLMANKSTLGTLRHTVDNLMTPTMQYPTLRDTYRIDPMNWGRYDAQGRPRIQQGAKNPGVR